MNKDNNKYLPIGTVVLLNDAIKRIMITGFCVKDNNNQNQIYDYCGILFPEGEINSDKKLVFNHNQISQIYHMGLNDEEEKDFKKNLTEYLNYEKNRN